MLRGRSAIDFVQNAWPQLTPTEFVSAEWILSVWEFLPELGSPAVVVSGSHAGWGAIALTESRGDAGRSLVVAGAPLVDEHEVVTSGPVDVDAVSRDLVHILRQEAKTGTAVQLDCAVPDSHLARALAAHRAHWSLEPEPAPVIDLSALSVNALRHSKRLNRLARTGPVTFDVIEGHRLTAAVGTSFVERRLISWETRGRIHELPDVERSPAFPVFLGEMVHRMAVDRNARLHVVRAGGRTVAEDLMLGPVSDPLLYMRSYDPAFSACSPGRILLEHTLLGMSGSALRRLRTGRGDEAYKLAAGADRSCVITAVVGPHGSGQTK